MTEPFGGEPFRSSLVLVLCNRLLTAAVSFSILLVCGRLSMVTCWHCSANACRRRHTSRRVPRGHLFWPRNYRSRPGLRD